MTSKVYNILLTNLQRHKLTQLGGARWVRQQIDAAWPDFFSLPKQYASKEERNHSIATDIRSIQIVAQVYNVSPRTVEYIRKAAREQGKPVAVKRLPKKKPPEGGSIATPRSSDQRTVSSS